jgi:hypothetical protein
MRKTVSLNFKKCLQLTIDKNIGTFGAFKNIYNALGKLSKYFSCLTGLD